MKPSKKLYTQANRSWWSLRIWNEVEGESRGLIGLTKLHAKHCFSRSKQQFNSALSCDLCTKLKAILPATSQNPRPQWHYNCNKGQNFALGIWNWCLLICCHSLCAFSRLHFQTMDQVTPRSPLLVNITPLWMPRQPWKYLYIYTTCSLKPVGAIASNNLTINPCATTCTLASCPKQCHWIHS